MTATLKDAITKMRKWIWIRILVLLAFSVFVLLNSMDVKSPFVGIPVSLAFIYIPSVATGEIFFPHEKRFLKQILGLASFVLIMTLLGTFLILIVRFTETLSLASLIMLSLGICVFSALRKRENIHDAPKRVEGADREKKEWYLLLFPFLLSVGISFYGLLLARTGEGQISVWRYIPNFFLPVFFLASLSLVIILFFTRIHVWLKLALISLHSFLSHSVFLLVWYPGRYGDPWSYLGNARFIDNTGMLYAYEWLFSQRFIVDLIKYEAQYALVVFFRRMFTLDIYWVHVFLVPLLWSMFVPVFAYKLADLLAAKKSKMFPLLSAVCSSLFPTLIYWGAISHTFSLGLLFLLLLIMLLVYWVNTGRNRFLFLSFLTSVAVLFAHPGIGIFAFAFLFVSVTIQSSMHKILKLVCFLFVSVLFPYVSYLQGASFSLEGLLNPWNFLSFQSDLTTLLFVFGFLGLVFSVRGKLVKGRSAFVLFLFYVIVVASYYVSFYGMTGAVASDRLPSVTNLVLMPFVALGFVVTVNFLRAGFSRIEVNSLKKVVNPRRVSMLMICLLLSVQAAFALYEAYPRQEITEVQPAAYEVEAVLYIDSATGGRYVVLGDTNLATIAYGFLGVDYSSGTARGDFGIPVWDWWVQRLYSQMRMNPSIDIFEEALTKGRADVVYFVVSVRDPAYTEIVQRISEEFFPPDKVFGDGKLAVFKYPTALAPAGPSVRVTFDDGTSTEKRASARYVTQSEVYYTVSLWGHSSYNISDFPTHWTFRSLLVNDVSAQFEESSDVNIFLYKAGLKHGDFLEVVWRANNLYTNVGWKDDSFRYGWQVRPGYPGTISPNITTDGNVLSLSWNFTPGEYQYYYYVKSFNVSTNDYPYISVRWSSTGPVAYVTVSYEPEGEAAIVPINSESRNWTESTIQLWPDRLTAFVTVGITNLNNRSIAGMHSVYIDYILICGTG